MAIISRLSRLFQADFHAMLDELEEPGALLKQSLREMEADIAATQQRLAGLKQLQQQQTRALSAAEGQLNECDPQLDLCFAAGDEALARNLIRRRLELQKHVEQLKANLDEREAAINELDRLLRERQLHFDSVRQKAELFETTDDSARDPLYHVSEDDVDVALLAEKQKRQRSTKAKGGPRHD